jgi:hypothetical protein
MNIIKKRANRERKAKLVPDYFSWKNLAGLISGADFFQESNAQCGRWKMSKALKIEIIRRL